MKKRALGVIVLLSAVTLCSQTVLAADAQGRGRGRGQDKKAGEAGVIDRGGHVREGDAQGRGRGRGQAKKGDEAVVIDRDGHVRVIREYGRGGSLPPGLAKREALPPGLRKLLRERGELPPGLQKRLIPVPAPLIARLPPLPPYYQRYFIGDDLVVVDSRTNQVAAVIRDVWR